MFTGAFGGTLVNRLRTFWLTGQGPGVPGHGRLRAGGPWFARKTLGVTSPFFPGILLAKKPPKLWGIGWFLRRTMAEKNGEATPRKNGFWSGGVSLRKLSWGGGHKHCDIDSGRRTLCERYTVIGHTGNLQFRVSIIQLPLPKATRMGMCQHHPPQKKEVCFPLVCL